MEGRESGRKGGCMMDDGWLDSCMVGCIEGRKRGKEEGERDEEGRKN